MFGHLGFPEILIIMVIILLLFGAKRIPEIAGSMGKGIREFKKNINDTTRDLSDSARYDNRAIPPAGLDAEHRPVAEDEAAREPKRLI
ncbi:MAG: twin-arginine translocase TatA/TatE family subunit [Gemmatimonadaceae bacterium]|nr:twin-arginine translocase TatA/TatE family subunit [Gemmatimonadaceae bacterium]